MVLLISTVFYFLIGCIGIFILSLMNRHRAENARYELSNDDTIVFFLWPMFLIAAVVLGAMKLSVRIYDILFGTGENPDEDHTTSPVVRKHKIK